MSSLCLIGAFPPPVHGMAMVNAALRDCLVERGTAPVVLNTAAHSLDRALLQRVRRVGRVGAALFDYGREVLRGGGNTVYLSLSAGWGQLYEAAFVVLARLAGAQVYLHHHSFKYVERTTTSARLLFTIAGRSAVHVVLCDEMGHLLRDRYESIRATRVVGNAAFFGVPAPRHRSRLRSVGFLGNISLAKGIIDVLDVGRALASHGINTRIAGPYEDLGVRSEVEKATSQQPHIQYVGATYADAKEAFWESIDVLLFPSYLTEASPLVVLEALARGIPVIARSRGCLASMVSQQAGLLVGREHEYARVATQRVLLWSRDADVYAAASRAAAEESVRMTAAAREALEALLGDLMAATAAHARCVV